MPKKAKSKSRSKKSGKKKSTSRARTSKASAVVVKVQNQSKVSRSTQPKITYNLDGSITVSHKEFLREISTTTDYECDNIAINPGLLDMAPWLSGIAANYECYDIQNMMFHLKSQSGNLVSSTDVSLGVLGLACSYNSLDETPASRVEFESLQGAISGPPSRNMSMKIDARNSKTPMGGLRYIRTGANPSGSDERLYDTGNLYVMTTGAQAAYVAATLWISYRVKLMKPKLLAPLLAYNNLTALYQDSGTVSVTPTDMFNGLVANDNNQLSLSFNGTNSFTLPDAISTGSYVMAYSVYGSTAASQTASSLTPSFTNAQALNIFPTGTTVTSLLVGNGDENGSSSKYFKHVSAFKVRESPASVYFAPVTGTGFPGNKTGASLVVLPINGRITTSLPS